MSASIENRKARRDYHILEKLEAGIQLVGTEVKSIRAGKATLQDAFARVENGEVFLYGMNIQAYDQASHTQHEPLRPRKLLLHRHEIDHLFGASAIKGQALVPLKLYWKNHKAKIELAIGKGKAAHDKRETIKKRTMDREAQRTMTAFNKRGR